MASGQELPSPLLRCFSPSAGSQGLLSGLGWGHPGGIQRRLRFFVFKVALVTREGDGGLQLAPPCGQAQALGLQARVFTSELLPEQVHCVSRPLKELLAASTALP